MVDAGLQLDANGDLEVDRAVLITNSELVRQRLECRFRSMLGDWFLDQSFGADYFNSVGPATRVRLTFIEGMLKGIINTCPGVTALVAFELTYDPTTSRLLLEFEATTDEETISATGEAEEGSYFLLLWG